LVGEFNWGVQFLYYYHRFHAENEKKEIQTKNLQVLSTFRCKKTLQFVETSTVFKSCEIVIFKSYQNSFVVIFHWDNSFLTDSFFFTNKQINKKKINTAREDKL
jgi:hypothetical protein